jgi:hypothetical protein
MKDDERLLLGAAQAAGKFVPVAGVTARRQAAVRNKWVRMKLLHEDGTLTHKGHGASGGVRPVEPRDERGMFVQEVVPDEIVDTSEDEQEPDDTESEPDEPEDFDDEEYDDA